MSTGISSDGLVARRRYERKHPFALWPLILVGGIVGIVAATSYISLSTDQRQTAYWQSGMFP